MGENTGWGRVDGVEIKELRHPLCYVGCLAILLEESNVYGQTVKGNLE